MSQEIEKTKARGGKRPGAGRPKVTEKQKTVTIRIDNQLAEIWDAIPNKSKWVCEKLREITK